MNITYAIKLINLIKYNPSWGFMHHRSNRFTIMPTQGFNVKTLNNEGFKLNVWDIGGTHTHTHTHTHMRASDVDLIN